MNMKNEITREQINKIHSLCLDINSLEARKGNNAPTVFYDFSGHVAGVRVGIHWSGWKSGEEADVTFSFYANCLSGDKDIDECNKCINYLEGLKNELSR